MSIATHDRRGARVVLQDGSDAKSTRVGARKVRQRAVHELIEAHATIRKRHAPRGIGVRGACVHGACALVRVTKPHGAAVAATLELMEVVQRAD